MRIAEACGLGLVGVDFRLTEVSGDVAHAHPSLLEINLTPGLRMHHYPGVGTPRNVAALVLDEILRRRAVWKRAEQLELSAAADAKRTVPVPPASPSPAPSPAPTPTPASAAKPSNSAAAAAAAASSSAHPTPDSSAAHAPGHMHSHAHAK